VQRADSYVRHLSAKYSEIDVAEVLFEGVKDDDSKTASIPAMKLEQGADMP